MAFADCSRHPCLMNNAATDNMPLLNDADYARIEQAIVYIHRHFRDQPSLETIASQADLSPAHFNRLFARQKADTAWTIHCVNALVASPAY